MSEPLRDVFGISFEERCSANGCPLQTRDLDALQARQQRSQIPLIFRYTVFGVLPERGPVEESVGRLTVPTPLAFSGSG